ncbi:hypothetical protein B0H21DRAFT_714848 [Amylocystis lapponica]|nr:hypothetical protein B0H21DRAFT_714848 [Amylocystis lapponica]
MRLPLTLVPLSICLLVSARLHHSLVPDDPYAFPKYRVTFLNGLPVLNETAERWLRDGLHGGELEFLDQPWKDPQWQNPQFKGIEGTEDPHAASPPPPAPSQSSNYALEHMRLGPQASYLCLIPPPPEDSTQPLVEDSSTDLTPVHSWSLLQPLAGSCLYHKHGWFTYSYCHNSHVRQFHELPQQQPHRPGEYKPEEDTEWEAYTLGRAPPTLEAGAELTVAEEAALAANVELARGAGSRYLVQRWGDGTYCDKTGRQREIEVQFHCSMTMTDTILFVKETQTCHYVLHIATPRLCGEPGFKSRRDAREEAYIRCREVLGPDAHARADAALPAAARPLGHQKRRKPAIAPPPPPAEDQGGDAPRNPNDVFRRALERLLARGDLGAPGGDAQGVVEPLDDGEGEGEVMYIEADFVLDGDDGGEGETLTLSGESLMDVLRAAGYDIKAEKEKEKENGASKKNGAAAKAQGEADPEEAETLRRDEL